MIMRPPVTQQSVAPAVALPVPVVMCDIPFYHLDDGEPYPTGGYRAHVNTVEMEVEEDKTHKAREFSIDALIVTNVAIVTLNSIGVINHNSLPHNMPLSLITMRLQYLPSLTINEWYDWHSESP